MILTPIRRYGAMILMLLNIAISGELLAKTHTATTSHNPKAVNKSILAIVQRVVHFLICENTLPEHQGKKRFSGRLCLILPVKMLPLRRIVTG